MNLLPTLLLPWYFENARNLPWRRDSEPYHVWLSEIMLQQTRVEAVKGYYTRFLAALPDIAALAAAPEDRVLKLWEGLGYYSRARNLQKAASVVMAKHGGVFPRKYEQIRALPGIGDYTAGAIASICFALPQPAVDGNVLRIMARITGYRESVDTPAVKARFRTQLAGLYPEGSCGAFTQALMELGACLCTPRSPKCADCPVQCLCTAYGEGLQALLPVKAQKKPRRIEERTVFAFICDGRVALNKRPQSGLLAGLWELPAMEGQSGAQEALEKAATWGLEPLDMEKTMGHTHVFTHVEWHMCCHFVRCLCAAPAFVWATGEEIEDRYALPSAFRPFLVTLQEML